MTVGYNAELDKDYCSICGHERIFVKKDIWLCPGLEGSPMHWHGLISADDTSEKCLERFEKFFAEKGCTLDEYRKVHDKYFNKFLEISS